MQNHRKYSVYCAAFSRRSGTPALSSPTPYTCRPPPAVPQPTLNQQFGACCGAAHAHCPLPTERPPLHCPARPHVRLGQRNRARQQGRSSLLLPGEKCRVYSLPDHVSAPILQGARPDTAQAPFPHCHLNRPFRRPGLRLLCLSSWINL